MMACPCKEWEDTIFGACGGAPTGNGPLLVQVLTPGSAQLQDDPSPSFDTPNTVHIQAQGRAAHPGKHGMGNHKGSVPRFFHPPIPTGVPHSSLGISTPRVRLRRTWAVLGFPCGERSVRPGRMKLDLGVSAPPEALALERSGPAGRQGVPPTPPYLWVVETRLGECSPVVQKPSSGPSSRADRFRGRAFNRIGSCRFAHSRQALHQTTRVSHPDSLMDENLNLTVFVAGGRRIQASRCGLV
jgi:hypothetical protein